MDVVRLELKKGMGKKPIIRSHCRNAQWTKGLSSTPIFHRKKSSYTPHALHDCSVPSVEGVNVPLR